MNVLHAPVRSLGGYLVVAVRSGELRLFSEDECERNAAVYQAAASLPVTLSRGTARRYVVQALARLEDTGAAEEASVSADLSKAG